MTAASTPLAAARDLFGDDMLGPDDVGRVLGADPGALAGDAARLASVPYDTDTLAAAKRRGEMLVLRVPSDGAAPLTILRFVERFPDSIDAKLLKGVGYLLKDEWTLDQEAFAREDTCTPEWRLVHKEPIPATLNLSYELQDAALARYAESVGLAGRLRRRRAIEMVYDTIMVAQARGTRLLAHTWDWSNTPTSDGGLATAGELGPNGLHVLGYSRAVRFGTLGICGQH
jgi:hypothetical protein